MEQSAVITTGLGRLAGLAYADEPEADALISDILKLIAESLDVGVAYLNRIEGDTLSVERAHDRVGMGVRAGISMPLGDTY